MKDATRRVVIVCVLVGLPVAACESSTSQLTSPDAGQAADGKMDGTTTDGKPSPVGDGPAASSDGALLDSKATGPDAGAGSLDSATGTTDGLATPDLPLGWDGLPPSPGVDGAADFPVGVLDAGLSCGQVGAVCQNASDCCGLACVAGLCSATACVSDGKSCTSGAECCSTICGAGGTCTALNPTCKTAGNACTTNAECCNGTCNSSHQCAPPGSVSFCAQAGDLCRADSECCTGVCTIAQGGKAGTCAKITTSCKIDGTLCSGCGDCCSHFCGPFGAGGPKICQPASGCHVQGDLCRKDSDCCGGDVRSGLPGAGLIKCELDPAYGSRIGTCGNPSASNCPAGSPNCRNACNPEGNVCHFKQPLICAGLINVRNDCCDCISGKECCQPDTTGIPRCNSLAACVPVGGNCSFSGECCNHEPCLPDPVTGQLKCGSACVPVGGACTTNADCCTGTLCQSTPGSVGGICVVPLPPVQQPDAGVKSDTASSVDDATVVDDALPPATPDAPITPDEPPVCGYWGQSCSTSSPCCGTIQCSAADGSECTASDTDCACFNPV
jgi:hypothetical protein